MNPVFQFVRTSVLQCKYIYEHFEIGHFGQSNEHPIYTCHQKVSEDFIDSINFSLCEEYVDYGRRLGT